SGPSRSRVAFRDGSRRAGRYPALEIRRIALFSLRRRRASRDESAGPQARRQRWGGARQRALQGAVSRAHRRPGPRVSPRRARRRRCRRLGTVEGRPGRGPVFVSGGPEVAVVKTSKGFFEKKSVARGG